MFLVGLKNLIPVLQFLKKSVRTKLLSVRHHPILIDFAGRFWRTF